MSIIFNGRPRPVLRSDVWHILWCRTYKLFNLNHITFISGVIFSLFPLLKDTVFLSVTHSFNCEDMTEMIWCHFLFISKDKKVVPADICSQWCKYSITSCIPSFCHLWTPFLRKEITHTESEFCAFALTQSKWPLKKKKKSLYEIETHKNWSITSGTLALKKLGSMYWVLDWMCFWLTLEDGE